MDNKEKVRILRLRDAMWRSHNAKWRSYIEQRDEMTTSNILASPLHRKKSTLELPLNQSNLITLIQMVLRVGLPQERGRHANGVIST